MLIEIKKYSGLKCYYKKNSSKNYTQPVFHNTYGAAFLNKLTYKEYYLNNKLHNLKGPAVIYSNGEKEYWEWGVELRG